MKFTVNLGPRSYSIIIKPGVLKRAYLLANLGGKTLLVADAGVPQKAVRALAAQCARPVVLTLPGGEAGKTAATAHDVAARMLAEGLGGHDAVLALGGGAVCHVAGYAAAQYLGGVPFYAFPSTAMAQLEAAVAGRPSVNLAGRVDVLSVLCPPALVALDPQLLASLPHEVFCSGLAAALKTGLMLGPDLFTLLEELDTAAARAAWEKLLVLNLLHKKHLMEEDEAGQGRQRLLGFGQLVGHAVLACAPGLSYGAALGLGMLPFIENKSLLRRTRALLRKWQLPVKLPCPPDALAAYYAASAQREAGRFTIPRVKRLGQGYLETVSEEELRLLVADGF